MDWPSSSVKSATRLRQARGGERACLRKNAADENERLRKIAGSRRRVRGWRGEGAGPGIEAQDVERGSRVCQGATRGRRARTRLRRESVKGERRGDRALTGPERGHRARARQESRALRVRLCAHREAGGGGGGARRDASREGRPRRRKRVGQTALATAQDAEEARRQRAFSTRGGSVDAWGKSAAFANKGAAVGGRRRAPRSGASQGSR